MSNIDKVRQILAKYNQEHILTFYNELTEKQKENLQNQILSINFDLLDKLYKNAEEKNEEQIIEPINRIAKDSLTKEEKEHFEKIGENMIRAGKIAVCQMAGGQRYKAWTPCTKRHIHTKIG